MIGPGQPELGAHPCAARSADTTPRLPAGVANVGEGGGAIVARPAVVRDLSLDEDEVVLLVLAPSPWFVPFACLGSLLAIACGVLAMAWASRLPMVPWSDGQAFMLGGALAAARLAWQAVEWVQRLYVLTDRRVLRRSGVLRALVAEERLSNLRHTVVVAARRERAVGVGTLAFVTATTAGLDWTLAWDCVRRPEEAQQVVREAIERYGR